MAGKKAKTQKTKGNNKKSKKKSAARSKVIENVGARLISPPSLEEAEILNNKPLSAKSIENQTIQSPISEPCCSRYVLELDNSNSLDVELDINLDKGLNGMMDTINGDLKAGTFKIL